MRLTCQELLPWPASVCRTPALVLVLVLVLVLARHHLAPACYSGSWTSQWSCCKDRCVLVVAVSVLRRPRLYGSPDML